MTSIIHYVRYFILVESINYLGANKTNEPSGNVSEIIVMCSLYGHY
jgi:hypothetical protein